MIFLSRAGRRGHDPQISQKKQMAAQDPQNVCVVSGGFIAPQYDVCLGRIGFRRGREDGRLRRYRRALGGKTAQELAGSRTLDRLRRRHRPSGPGDCQGRICGAGQSAFPVCRSGRDRFQGRFGRVVPGHHRRGRGRRLLFGLSIRTAPFAPTAW